MYDRSRGSVIIKPAMLQDADAFKIGGSPLAVLHDPATGEQMIVGWNHPAIIPGCVVLVDFVEKNTSTLYDKSELGNNFSVTNLASGDYIDTIFGVGINNQGDEYASNGTTNLGGTGDCTWEMITTINGTSERYWCFLSYSYSGYSGGLYSWIKLTTGASAIVVASFPSWIKTDNSRFHHFAVTWDAATKTHRLYIDGMLLGSNTESYERLNGQSTHVLLAYTSGTSYNWIGKTAAFRLTERCLKPHEFMHHWYFNSLVNGSFNSDGAILFDPQVSAFRARKIFTVEADWDSRGQMRSSNIIVNNIRGVPDESFVPLTNDPSKMIVGGLPLVDDKTVGMWILDGRVNEDGKVIDLSAEGNHGALVSLADADLVNSRFGRYYDLDGENDYVQVPDAASLDVGVSDFSLIFLFKNSGNDGLVNSLVTRYNVSEHGYAIWILTSGVISIRFNDSVNGEINIGGTTDIGADGKWHTAAFTMDRDGNGICYLDGIAENTTDISSKNANVDIADDLKIGVHRTGGAEFKGQIAFVHISNVVRSANWIAHMAQCLFRANAQFQDLEAPRAAE